MSSIVTSSVWAGGGPATALARLVPTLDPAQQPLPPTLPAELLILSALGRVKVPALPRAVAGSPAFLTRIHHQPPDLSTLLLPLQEPLYHPFPPQGLAEEPHQLQC